jgi:hypothetical protein
MYALIYFLRHDLDRTRDVLNHLINFENKQLVPENHTRKQTTDSDTAHDRQPTDFASFAKARETHDFGSTD